MYRRSLDLVRVTRARTLRLCAGMTQAQSDYTPDVEKHRDIYSRLIQMRKAGQRRVVHIGFNNVNTSIAFIPKTIPPMLEIPFPMLNLFVPTRVREAIFAVPQQGKSIAAQALEEILRSRQFAKVA